MTIAPGRIARRTTLQRLALGLVALTLTLAGFLTRIPPAGAADPPTAPAAAETIRADLTTAQLSVERDPDGARRTVEEASALYTQALAPTMAQLATEADGRARAGFADLLGALARR